MNVFRLSQLKGIALIVGLSVNLVFAADQTSTSFSASETQIGIAGQKISLKKHQAQDKSNLFIPTSSHQVGGKCSHFPSDGQRLNGHGPSPNQGTGPRRDDPFDDWITYDDGNDYWLQVIENYWSRVAFTAESRFVLQGINFQVFNPGPNTDDACQVLVYSEDQDNHNLTDLLWETQIRSVDPYDRIEPENNWNFIEIPEDDWMTFDEGENFSILYGPAPGGEYNIWDVREGFEDFELNEPPEGGGWSYDETGESSVRVSDREVYSGDQSVRFRDPRDNEDDWCYLSFDHDEASNGRMYFRLMLSPDGYFGFDAFSEESVEFILQFNDDNRILTNDGDEYVWANGEWPEDEWFTIYIEFSSENNSFTVMLNDDIIVDGNEFVNGDPINNLWFLCFSGEAVMEDA